jgi:hypothetical protein
MDRPGTYIILDKKYNIANSSCHFGSYGSIWTGPSPKNIKWTSEASVHIIFFWWRTGPYTAIWPSVPWTICCIYVYFVSLFIHWHHNKTLKENSKTPYQRPRHAQDKPDSVTLGTCVLMVNNLSSDYHWGTVWEPYRLWICWMFFTKCIYKNNLYKILL